MSHNLNLDITFSLHSSSQDHDGRHTAHLVNVSAPSLPVLISTSLQLSPHTLLPPTSISNARPITFVPPVASPAPIPPSSTLSLTHNYPSPSGHISLGGSLSAHLRLSNTRQDAQPVLGVKMMVEIQGPSGRFRLGEVIHQSDDPFEEQGVPPPSPALASGQVVELEVEDEMKELGLHVLICSVAWETLDGRRTFQRFLKYNVTPS